MELTNKKINFLGDSITEGCHSSTYETCFVEVLRRELSLAQARNYGIGGTRIARQHTPSAVAKYDRDFCSRVEEMDEDADVVIAFGGTNDYGHGDAPLGAGSDRTSDTFHGACHVLCRKLLVRYPDAKVVMLTPLHRANDALPNASGAVLADYVQILRETAAQYRIPVLDLFETSALRADLPEVAARLTTDGLHPNDPGHALLAAEIAAFLRSL